MKEKFDWKSFWISLIAVVFVAGLSSIFTFAGMDWYDTLKTPSSFPPSWLFSVVWTIIYVCIGFVLYRLISERKIDLATLIIFTLNGLLNILWCFVFFFLGSVLWGLVVLILNVIASILMVLKVYKTNKNWAYFLIIYPIWILVANALNMALWILN